MNDSRLGEWMREQPRTKASPAFTREVMRAIGGRESRRPLFWRLAAAFAMAVCLVIVAQVAVTQRRHEQLRAERQQLEAELEAVKRIASEAEPKVVLENDRGTRVIMDLDTAIQPASLRNYD